MEIPRKGSIAVLATLAIVAVAGWAGYRVLEAMSTNLSSTNLSAIVRV